MMRLLSTVSRRLVNRALTSAGDTSMMGVLMEASTPTATPRPIAALALCAPDGTSTNTSSGRLSTMNCVMATYSSRPLRRFSLLLRTSRRLPSPLVWTSSMASGAKAQAPRDSSSRPATSPMLAKAGSMPTTRITCAPCRGLSRGLCPGPCYGRDPCRHDPHQDRQNRPQARRCRGCRRCPLGNRLARPLGLLGQRCWPWRRSSCRRIPRKAWG